MFYHYTAREDPTLTNNGGDALDNSATTGLFAEWRMNKADADFGPNWWDGYHHNKSCPVTLYPTSPKVPTYIIDPHVSNSGTVVANFSNAYIQQNLTFSPETDGVPEALGSYPSFYMARYQEDLGTIGPSYYPSGNTATDGFTVEFWFYHKQQSKGVYFAIGNALTIEMQINSNVATLDVRGLNPQWGSVLSNTATSQDNNGDTWTFNAYPPLLNTWNHLAVTYTPKRLVLANPVNTFNQPLTNQIITNSSVNAGLSTMDIFLNGKWWPYPSMTVAAGGGLNRNPDWGIQNAGWPMGLWAQQNICIGGSSKLINSTFSNVYMSAVKIWNYSKYNPVPNAITNAVTIFTGNAYTSPTYTAGNFTPTFPGYGFTGNNAITPSWPTSNATEFGGNSSIDNGPAAPANGTVYYQWNMNNISDPRNYTPDVQYISNMGTNAVAEVQTYIVAMVSNTDSIVPNSVVTSTEVMDRIVLYTPSNQFQGDSWASNTASPTVFNEYFGQLYIGNAVPEVTGNSSALANGTWKMGVLGFGNHFISNPSATTYDAVADSYTVTAGSVAAGLQGINESFKWVANNAPLSNAAVYYDAVGSAKYTQVNGYMTNANTAQNYLTPYITSRPGDTVNSMYFQGAEIGNNYVLTGTSALHVGFESFSTAQTYNELEPWLGNTVLTFGTEHDKGGQNDFTTEFWFNWDYANSLNSAAHQAGFASANALTFGSSGLGSLEWSPQASLLSFETDDTYKGNSLNFYMYIGNEIFKSNPSGNTLFVIGPQIDYDNGQYIGWEILCSIDLTNATYGFQKGKWNHISLVNKISGTPIPSNPSIIDPTMYLSLNGVQTPFNNNFSAMTLSSLSGYRLVVGRQMKYLYMKNLIMRSGNTYTGNFTPTAPAGLANVATLWH